MKSKFDGFYGFEKRRKRRNLKLFGYFIGFVLLLWGVGYFGRNFVLEKMAEREVAEILKVEQEDAQKYNPAIRTEKIQSKNLTIYANYPQDESGNEDSTLNNFIDQRIELLKANTYENQTVVFLKVYQKDFLSTVAEQTVYESQYSYIDSHYQQDKIIDIAHFYISKEEQKSWTLIDLFIDEIGAISSLYPNVTDTLVKQQVDRTLIEEVQKAFHNEEWKSFGFGMTEDELVLYPTGELAQKMAEIRMPLYPFVFSLKKEIVKERAHKAKEELQAKREADKGKKRIALTFDDGPRAGETNRVLDLLKQYNAKGTFFILGSNVSGNEDLIKRMVSEGHQLGNHSWSHPNLTKLSPEEITQEVQKAAKAIREASGGIDAWILRPPYGSFDSKVSTYGKLPAVNWSIDTLDWQTRDSAAIFDVVKTYARDGGIILMHDIHPTSVDALPDILKFLSAEGYEMVTVDELRHHEPLRWDTVYFDRTDEYKP